MIRIKINRTLFSIGKPFLQNCFCLFSVFGFGCSTVAKDIGFNSPTLKTIDARLSNSFSVPISKCEQWGTPHSIGNLERSIKESSGITFSSVRSDRLYHINDSGSAGEFFISTDSGKPVSKVEIIGFNPFDTEDIDVGPCPAGSCVFIGDIGDNLTFRNSIGVTIVKDMGQFPGEVTPLCQLSLNYGQGRKFNAESLMLHPKGDLFIVTKQKENNLQKSEVKIFKLPYKKIWNPKVSTHTLEEVGTIDIANVLKEQMGADTLVTAGQIHPDGKRFILLTYSHAIEFHIDLLTAFPQIDPEIFDVIQIKRLAQQESITYSHLEDGFFYTTEGRGSPLMKVSCLKRRTLN